MNPLKVCKYKYESDNSVPFVILTRVVLCSLFFGNEVLLESVSWTLGEVLI